LNDRTRNNPVLRIARIVAGSVLCVVGVVLGPIPIVPGFPVLIVGLALLAQDVPFVRTWVGKAKARSKRWLAERRRDAKR
jgi:hypothetical protein